MKLHVRRACLHMHACRLQSYETACHAAAFMHSITVFIIRGAMPVQMRLAWPLPQGAMVPLLSRGFLKCPVLALAQLQHMTPDWVSAILFVGDDLLSSACTGKICLGVCCASSWKETSRRRRGRQTGQAHISRGGSESFDRPVGLQMTGLGKQESGKSGGDGGKHLEKSQDQDQQRHRGKQGPVSNVSTT